MHGARNVGGGEYSIYYLIKNLRKDIFEPIVFYSSENEITARLREDGIRLINIPLNKKITSVYRDEIKKNPISLLIYARHLISGIVKIIKSVKEFQIDILHPHDNLSKIIGGIAGKIAGVKVVTHCRDALGNDLVGRILKMTYLFLADKVISVSEKTADFLRTNRALSKKIEVIYNGVDLNLFKSVYVRGHARRELGIQDDCIVIEIIAILESYKGHRYLFQAIKELKENGIRNIKCLVIGDGREKDKLIEIVENLCINNEVLFFGYRKDVPYLLGSADILVIPSISQEAFPRVALEAMAMKVPVVCTDFGGLPEAVINMKTGIVVPAEDSDAIYKATKYLIENPEIGEKMGEIGRKRVEGKFSIENNVRKTEALYLGILKKTE